MSTELTPDELAALKEICTQCYLRTVESSPQVESLSRRSLIEQTEGLGELWWRVTEAGAEVLEAAEKPDARSLASRIALVIRFHRDPYGFREPDCPAEVHRLREIYDKEKGKNSFTEAMSIAWVTVLTEMIEGHYGG